MNFQRLFREKWINIANFLSLFRLCFLPPFLYFGYVYSQNPQQTLLWLLLGIVFLAAVTDFLDGFLARRLKLQTQLGRYLDPLCDKIVSLSAFSLLVFFFQFPLWAYIFYLLREVSGIWLGAFLYFRRHIQGTPNYWGKASVALSVPLVAWYISALWFRQVLPANHWLLHPVLLVYLWVAALIIGILVYGYTYWNVVFDPGKGSEKP